MVKNIIPDSKFEMVPDIYNCEYDTNLMRQYAHQVGISRLSEGLHIPNWGDFTIVFSNQ